MPFKKIYIQIPGKKRKLHPVWKSKCGIMYHYKTIAECITSTTKMKYKEKMQNKFKAVMRVREKLYTYPCIHKSDNTPEQYSRKSRQKSRMHRNTENINRKRNSLNSAFKRTFLLKNLNKNLLKTVFVEYLGEANANKATYIYGNSFQINILR